MPDPRELASVVTTAAGSPTEPFGLYAFSADDDLSELARSVEREAFDEFFGNSPELLAQEYGPFEHATVFLTVLDQRRQVPAGMMRLIFPSPMGLKSLIDVEPAWGQPVDEVVARADPPVDLAKSVDITTFAVAPEYRGRAANGLVSLALYQAVSQAAARCALRWAVTILDVRVLNLVQRSLSAPFEFFPGVEPIEYLGSKASAPVFCDFVKYFARLASDDPSLREILAEGRGIEPAVRPTEWGSTLARVLPERRLRIA